ncbi:NADH-quinone oxidoreductase subunit N [Nonomuraea sp. MG754425]|uniref:NADH-quinone oxidoreductase subunit N n=1 Tax=Nonomuraea sp. MG754425 TaxID=2570319 RepID=UPI001F45BF65|nr:NADH-quinone oxidoreductase subunit N [Nonomuraea sp. MG754425]MCF6474515.1 NADH-quinone oxidoreductase subunit N [Nonomuraea sp. MG754425]
MSPAALLPELLILAGAVAGLVTGLFTARERQWVTAWINAAGLGGAALTTMTSHDMSPFEGYAVDVVTNVARITVSLATILVLGLAAGWARAQPRESELYTLISLAALGAILMAGAADLLVLVAAYLLASIPAYALAGFAKDAAGTEAALKYYLMGAFLGVVMLAGVTLAYGHSGATSYPETRAPAVAAVLLLGGLLFKAGGVPAHFWVPDVAQGASRPVAAFVTTVPKVGAFAALYRLASDGVIDEPALFAVLAAATMTLGNLAAFHQDNVRRLLAYSTISQAGYLLVPVAVAGRTELAAPALLYYLAAYAITNLGAFAVVVTAGADSLREYAGLARRSPWAASALVVCLLGLVGTPPTAVFAGKLLMFAAAWDGGYAWLAVLAAANTVASLFYYLRWIRPVFARQGAPGERRVGAVAVIAAAGSVLLGVGAGLVLLA